MKLQAKEKKVCVCEREKGEVGEREEHKENFQVDDKLMKVALKCKL